MCASSFQPTYLLKAGLIEAMQKRALLQACLQKVAKMASDKDALYHSALQKISEFTDLQYPRSVLRGVCTYLGATTGEGTWINVRHAI